jgi:hypothetical protein
LDKLSVVYPRGGKGPSTYGEFQLCVQGSPLA